MLLWFLCCEWVLAKPAASQRMHAPKSVPRFDTVQVSLGQSTAPLFGPWKFQTGDSPLDPMTHAPLWAEPDFDD